MAREQQSGPLSRSPGTPDWHRLIQSQCLHATIGRYRSEVAEELLNQAITTQLPFSSSSPFMAVARAQGGDVCFVLLECSAIVSVLSKMGCLQKERPSVIRFVEPTGPQSIAH